MSEWGTPYQTSEELLEGLNNKVEDMVELLSASLSSLFEQLEGSVGKASKTLGDSKTFKATDALQKFAKSLKNAPGLFILEQLMKLLEPFMMLLEPIGVLFDILSGILSIFTGEMMKAIFDALQPLFDLLVDLMPIIKIIAGIFGEFVKIGMIPLKVILEVLGAVLKPFLPIFEKLAPIFDLLTPLITMLVKFGMLPLVLAVYGLARAFATVIDVITWLIDAIDIFNLTPVRATNFGASVDSMFLPIIGDLIGLADGGVVQEEGIYKLGEGGKKEAVVPLEKAGMSTGGDNELHLINMNDNLEQLVMLQRRQVRSQRRKFG